MSRKLKLKPCPFCGGKADFSGSAGAVLAGCSKCNIYTIYCYPPEDAAQFWNSRPAEDAKNARIVELEQMAEARKLANRLLEQERNELEVERDRMRKALQAIARFANNEYEKRILAPSCVEFLTIKLCAKNALKEAENREDQNGGR